MLSKIPVMRLIFTVVLLGLAAAIPMRAASPEPTPTLPLEAADVGKDQVHALNNAFAHVFETVAPSVVIIEVSKKNDGTENSAFDDLFFQGQPDETNPHRGLRGFQPIQSEGLGFIAR